MVNKYEYQIDLIELIASNSTCSRVHVGCCIMKDNRIISTGWNGVTKGSRHCVDIFNEMFPDEEKWGALEKERYLLEHGKFSKQFEIHAEQNAIAFAARNGLSIDGCDLFVSISPCQDCAKLIVASGIKRVYYIKEYDRDLKHESITFLNANSVETIIIEKQKQFAHDYQHGEIKITNSMFYRKLKMGSKKNDK